MVSNLFRQHKLILKVSAVCFVTALIITGVFLAPPIAHAKMLSTQQVKEQSLLLYQRLHNEKRSPSEVDAALQGQFGLQRLNVEQVATAFTSTSSDVDLPTPSIYRDRTHGVTFVYADFNWKVPLTSDPMDYKDVFGIWFTQAVSVGSTSLDVTELVGPSQHYTNTDHYNPEGVDYVEDANYWRSGDVEVAFNGDFPAGCTQIFSKYTHGWSSKDLTSTSVSVGLPSTVGIQVTYTVTDHSWQTTSPQPAQYGCPGERPDPGM
jgi:hypothetical protein